MRVKRYVVDSMPDALEKIRVDLGSDAIILNTKQVKTGGILGFFAKQQIEVIAAIDPKAAAEKAEQSKQPERMSAGSNSFAAKQAYQRTTAKPVDLPEKKPNAAMPVSPNSRGEAKPNLAGAVSHSNQETAHAAVAQAETVRKQQEAELTGEIAKELRGMREVFQKVLVQAEANANLPACVLAVRDRLVKQEVEEPLIAQIITELLKALPNPLGTSEQQAFEKTGEIIQHMLSEATKGSLKLGHTTKFAFFFGPTGVGKTTTIAKLAAEAMLKDKRKVGFITTDTFRIGAVEQLKTYANILNVPVEVVFSPKELAQAMERLEHCDLIFIDTAGRNYRNDEFVQGIKTFLLHGETSQNYLVLSLSSKYIDMKPIISNFHDVIARVIFTKADETQAYGAILNVTKNFALPLSYITVGQNVPDDIVIASSDIVTKMIVGDVAYA